MLPQLPMTLFIYARREMKPSYKNMNSVILSFAAVYCEPILHCDNHKTVSNVWICRVSVTQ